MTPPRTWAQVQSKAQKTRKKFNQLKQEHAEICLREAKVCATHLSPLVFPPSYSLSPPATPRPPALLFLCLSYFLIHDEQMSFILYLVFESVFTVL